MLIHKMNELHHIVVKVTKGLLNEKYPLIIAVRLKNIKEIDGLLIKHQNIIIPIGKIIITNGDVLIPIRKNNI